jgi:hypothetical protein
MAGLIKLNYREIKSHGDGSGWEYEGVYDERGCGDGHSSGSCNCEKHIQLNSGYGYIECADRDLMIEGIAYGSGDGAYCILKIN